MFSKAEKIAVAQDILHYHCSSYVEQCKVLAELTKDFSPSDSAGLVKELIEQDRSVLDHVLVPYEMNGDIRFYKMSPYFTVMGACTMSGDHWRVWPPLKGREKYSNAQDAVEALIPRLRVPEAAVRPVYKHAGPQQERVAVKVERLTTAKDILQSYCLDVAETQELVLGLAATFSSTIAAVLVKELAELHRSVLKNVLLPDERSTREIQFFRMIPDWQSHGTIRYLSIGNWTVVPWTMNRPEYTTREAAVEAFAAAQDMPGAVVRPTYTKLRNNR